MIYLDVVKVRFSMHVSLDKIEEIIESVKPDANDYSGFKVFKRADLPRDVMWEIARDEKTDAMSFCKRLIAILNEYGITDHTTWLSHE